MCDVLSLTRDAIRTVEDWAGTPFPADFKRARSKSRRDPADVTVFLVHQMAVLFGLSDRQIAAQPESLPTEERRRLARQARYKHLPYHGVWDTQSRVSIAQWPVWLHTYHAHGGNSASYGWALDGAYPGTYLDVEGAQASFAHNLEIAQQQGAKITHVESHAQHAASRGGDPGREIWHEVVIPVARERDLAVSRRTTGNGRIPAWM